jgi:hypothetical protein
MKTSAQHQPLTDADLDRLADLVQSRFAVLNSLASGSSQRPYDHTIR